MEQKYIKASDVAEMFGVTRQTIRNWVKKGILNGVMIDGTQFIHRESLQKVEDSINVFVVMEESIKSYKKRLKELEEYYRESIIELRKCIEGNNALVNSRKALLDVLPVLYDVIQPDSSETDSGCKVLQMLLAGDDIKTIAKTFNLTSERIKQLIRKKLFDISVHIESYRELKEERDKLLAEVDALRLNTRTHEKIQCEIKQSEDVRPNILTMRLSQCDLSVRTLHCLRSADIYTIGDLVSKRKSELSCIRNLGKVSLIELDDFIHDFGLEWGKYYFVQPDGSVVEAIAKT